MYFNIKKLFCIVLYEQTNNWTILIGATGIWGMLAIGLFADNPAPLDTTSGRKGLFKGIYELSLILFYFLLILLYFMFCCTFFQRWWSILIGHTELSRYLFNTLEFLHINSIIVGNVTKLLIRIIFYYWRKYCHRL